MSTNPKKSIAIAVVAVFVVAGITIGAMKFTGSNTANPNEVENTNQFTSSNESNEPSNSNESNEQVATTEDTEPNIYNFHIDDSVVPSNTTTENEDSDLYTGEYTDPMEPEPNEQATTTEQEPKNQGGLIDLTAKADTTSKPSTDNTTKPSSDNTPTGGNTSKPSTDNTSKPSDNTSKPSNTKPSTDSTSKPSTDNTSTGGNTNQNTSGGNTQPSTPASDNNTQPDTGNKANENTSGGSTQTGSSNDDFHSTGNPEWDRIYQEAIESGVDFGDTEGNLDLGIDWGD